MSRRWSVRERLLGALARLGGRLFFRRVEVDGAERVPAEGPLVLVANHANGLVDAMLLLGFLPAPSRPIATGVLWRNPFLRPFLAFGGAIPVRRRQDDAGPANNDDMFARCHGSLRSGGCLMIFPEGVSHDESRVLPLKTGAARIALEAETRFGPLGVRLVPVGLVFDDKHVFRSRALVVVGEALDPAPERELHGRDPAEAVRRLTARIEAALAGVAPHFESWDEARLLRRAAGMYARPVTDVPLAMPLAERNRLVRAFSLGYRRLREREPALVADVEREMREYDALLLANGLRDGQVASRYHGWLVVAHTVRAIQLALIQFPSALLGSLAHWLPYRAAGWIAATAAEEPTASWKLFASLLLFPAWWLLLALAAGWTWGWPAAAAVAAVAPYTAREAMRFHEERGRFMAEAAGFLRLRVRPELAAELRARRRALVGRIGSLVAADRATIG